MMIGSFQKCFHVHHFRSHDGGLSMTVDNAYDGGDRDDGQWTLINSDGEASMAACRLHMVACDQRY